MASTPFAFQADSGLTLSVKFESDGGTGTPATSYSATEKTTAKGWYTITITEALEGKFLWHAEDGSGNIVANGMADLVDDTTTYYGFDPVGNRGYPDVSAGYAADIVGTAGANLSSVPYNSAWTLYIASAVWDSLSTNYLDPGSFGLFFSEMYTRIDDSISNVISEINEIGVATGATSVTATAFVKTLGGTETNTVTATEQLDGTRHVVPADASDDIDVYYEFDVGTYGVPVEVVWNGYATTNNETYQVYFYNWADTVWEQAGTISGNVSTDNRERVFRATTAHVGSGGNVGKVRFRIESTTCTELATDRILCDYIVVLPEDGSTYSAIPWNAAWDAEVQSECADALAAYNGASFTSIPWNAAWDAEVQSECADALAAYNGASFTSIPWNAAWDAEVQSEVTDALTTYDVALETTASVAKDQATIAALNVQK